MIKLIKVLDLIGIEIVVSIYLGKEKLYFGTCGKVPKSIWEHAYIKKMDFDYKTEKYKIAIRYNWRDV